MSLQSSLLAAARNWEADRARETAMFRRDLADAKAQVAAAEDLVAEERAKVADLERSLKEEKEKAAAAQTRADALQGESTQNRLQALGCFLMLAEVREHLAELAPPKSKAAAAPALPGPTSPTKNSPSPPEGEDDDEEEGEDGDEDGADATGDADADEAKAAAKRRRNKRKKLKSKAKAAASAAGTNGEEGGALATAAAEEPTSPTSVVTSPMLAAWEAASHVLEPLPHIVAESELIAACREGKGRAVETFLSQSTMSGVAEGRAQDALVAALEEAVSSSSGKASIVKALLDGGADAHRTEALHTCISHGQLPILSHLVCVSAMSTNQLDKDGRSPLHVAAAANQPRAAQFLLKHAASPDTRDGEGRTAYEIAVAYRTHTLAAGSNSHRVTIPCDHGGAPSEPPRVRMPSLACGRTGWKEMQRVLNDPALLFYNRSSRATRLYKEREYELACECYERAQKEMERMRDQPESATAATFFFNFARSSQLATGRLVRATELFTKVLEASPSHERAIDHRAQCYESLGDLDAALSDLQELKSLHARNADKPTVAAWVKRIGDVKRKASVPAHETLGVARFVPQRTASSPGPLLAFALAS